MYSDLIVRFFKSALGPFTGLVGGILTGQFFPDFATNMVPFERVVSTIIRMCIMPILFTTVSLSIANFLTTKVELDLRKVLVAFVCIFLLSSSVGMSMAFLTQPGYSLDTEASAKLRQVAIESAEIERALDEPIEGQVSNGIVHFLQDAVPSNIFEAVAADKFLQVLVFSIIFGVALAFIYTKKQAPITNILEAVKETFKKIYSTVRIVMPIVIFLRMATDFSEVGAETLIGMLPFLLSVYSAFFAMFVIGLVIISYKLKINPIKAAGMIQEPIVIAIVMHSGIAAMPSAIKALTENYKLDKTVVNMLASTGLVIGEFGVVLYFSFCCIFVAQYYDHSLASDPMRNLDKLIYILLMSGVASVATIGLTSRTSLSMMSLVLDPLGLPLSGFLVLFYLVEYIIKPFQSVILLHCNLTAIVLITGKPIQADGFAHPPPERTPQPRHAP